MLKVTSAIRILASVEMLLVVGIPGTAQSEVSPDHFVSFNTEHFPRPRAQPSVRLVTEQHVDGTFSLMLPNNLECAGEKLLAVLAGHHSLSMRSHGKVGRVTLKQKEQSLEIAGVVQKPASEPGLAPCMWN